MRYHNFVSPPPHSELNDLLTCDAGDYFGGGGFEELLSGLCQPQRLAVLFPQESGNALRAYTRYLGRDLNKLPVWDRAQSNS
jgi:hypothetical protein